MVQAGQACTSNGFTAYAFAASGSHFEIISKPRRHPPSFPRTTRSPVGIVGDRQDEAAGTLHSGVPGLIRSRSLPPFPQVKARLVTL